MRESQVIAALFVYNVGVSLLALYVLVGVWPAASLPQPSSSLESVSLFFQPFTISVELAILLIVIMMGALGSLVYTSTALVTHVASKDFASNWTLWYLVHPLLGSSLAVVFYFALRGGLLNLSSGTTADLNLYGLGALSGMVGLSSKEATSKLKELFETLFEGNNSSKQRPKR